MTQLMLMTLSTGSMPLNILLLVGGIVNDHENVMMRKGAEMGHFELIGSTIVLLFKKGHIDLLPEIKECIKGDKEVRVIQGQHIANRTAF